ncbi:MAG: hypothetical protein ABI605_00900 [Rhizobacter sp.]
MTDDKRYAPPAAAVDDPASQPLLHERPKQVRHAVALLWLSFACGIVSLLLTAARRPEDLGEPVFVGLTVFSFGLAILLNVMVYKGKNWARITTLVFALLGALFLLMPSIEPVPPSLVEKAIATLDFAIEVIALYFLFTQPGSLWFKRHLSR